MILSVQVDVKAPTALFEEQVSSPSVVSNSPQSTTDWSFISRLFVGQWLLRCHCTSNKNLEYCIQFLYPHMVGVLEALEKVQRRATIMVPA